MIRTTRNDTLDESLVHVVQRVADIGGFISCDDESNVGRQYPFCGRPLVYRRIVIAQFACLFVEYLSRQPGDFLLDAVGRFQRVAAGLLLHCNNNGVCRYVVLYTKARDSVRFLDRVVDLRHVAQADGVRFRVGGVRRHQDANIANLVHVPELADHTDRVFPAGLLDSSARNVQVALVDGRHQLAHRHPVSLQSGFVHHHLDFALVATLHADNRYAADLGKRHP